MTTTFSGSPCIHGHGTLRYRVSKLCVECGRLAAVKHRAKMNLPENAGKKRDRRRSGRTNERAANAARRLDPANWAGILLIGARHRAKKSGTECTIRPDQIEGVTTCPVFGTKLKMGVGRLSSMDSPSLDRFDNSKGYVPGNVRMVSLRANMLKKDATAAEIAALARYMQGEVS